MRGLGAKENNLSYILLTLRSFPRKTGTNRMKATATTTTTSILTTIY